MTKKVLLAAILVGLTAVPALAATRTVNTDSTDAGLAGSLPYWLTNASDGDTIVFDASYTIANLPLDQAVDVASLTIDGGDNTIVIDNSALAEDGTMFHFNGAGITVRNMTFIAGPPATSGAGQIIMAVSSGFTLENCTLMATTPGVARDELYMRPGCMNIGGGTSDVTITNCYFEMDNDANQAISIFGSAGNPVTNVLVQDTGFVNCNEHAIKANGWVYPEQTAASPILDGLTVLNSTFSGASGRGWAGEIALFDHCANITIQGCTFGEEPDGTVPEYTGVDGDYYGGRSLSGVKAQGRMTNLLVGGTGEGEANIFHTIWAGYRFEDYGSYDGGLKARENIVYDVRNYASSSIQYLDDDFNTTFLTEKPTIISADVSGVSGTAPTGAVVEVYADIIKPKFPLWEYDGAEASEDVMPPACRTFLGAATVSDGTWTLSADLSGFDLVTATATMPTTGGDTSELAAAVIGAAGTDTDGDYLPDAWESEHGLDPASDGTEEGQEPADGYNGDPDGDGFTNIEELAGGSDPQDAASQPSQTPDGVPAAGFAGLAALTGVLAMAGRKSLK
jgi:hypothetical protein